MQKQSSLSNNGGRFRIRYEEQLSFSRLQVLMTTEDPLLVIAGAGSRKTRTLTYWVARLVVDGVSPASIHLLTFTRITGGSTPLLVDAIDENDQSLLPSARSQLSIISHCISDNELLILTVPAAAVTSMIILKIL